MSYASSMQEMKAPQEGLKHERHRDALSQAPAVGVDEGPQVAVAGKLLHRRRETRTAAATRISVNCQ